MKMVCKCRYESSKLSNESKKLGFWSILFLLDTFHKIITWLDFKYKNKQTKPFNR